jgi:tellurite methyltransferase
MWTLAPLGRYLDVRDAEASEHSAWRLAARIPLGELRKRTHELPDRSCPVLLTPCKEAAEAALRLKELGRAAKIVPEAGLSPARPGEGPWRLWGPNEFLLELLPHLRKGSALDLGCGSGREAVALSGHGWDVVAADRLPDALEKGRSLAQRYLIGPADVQEPPIRWLGRDLERDGLPEGRFDLAMSFRYLHRPLLRAVGTLLQPGGSVVLETFTTLHRERHGKPSQDAHVLWLGEAPQLVPGLEVLAFDEDWRGDSHTARLWARKP